jgi:hypothetical protein
MDRIAPNKCIDLFLGAFEPIFSQSVKVYPVVKIDHLGPGTAVSEIAGDHEIFKGQRCARKFELLGKFSHFGGTVSG